MIGRIMEKKLREARIEDFKGKVRGVKAILSDIKVTLKQVRKDNTTFPEEEFDNLKTLKVQVRTILKYLAFLSILNQLSNVSCYNLYLNSNNKKFAHDELVGLI